MALSIINAKANARNSSSSPAAPSSAVTGSQAGDLLIVIASVRGSDGAPNPASGWTEDSTHRQGPGAGTNMYTTVYYKYLSGTLSGAQVFDATARNQWEAACFLIRGATGTYATDVVDFHLFPNELVDGNYPYTTSSFNTTTNTQLLLCAGHDAEGTKLNPSLLAMSASGFSLSATNAFSAPNADGFGSFDNAVAGYGTVATSGTGCTITLSGGNNGSYAQAGIICLQSSSGTETANPVTLALTKASFAATVVDSPAPETTTLALAKANFSVQAQRTETATVNLSMARFGFSAIAYRMETATVTMALNGVRIAAYVTDVTAVSKLRQFHTFG